MNHFNSLPPELIEFIFKKVNFHDLINLRIVDKRFKEIFEQFKIKQLYVSDTINDNLYELNYMWFYTNDLIQFKKENMIKTSRILNYATIFQLDKNLKRLALRVDLFESRILNQFKALEQLEMVIDCLLNNCVLNLENLKIAHISIGIHFFRTITLNTKKLFAIRFGKLDPFFFNYPDKILFYETNHHNYNKYYNEIRSFCNLQYLKLTHLNNSLDREILSKFKNLNVLDLIVMNDLKKDNLNVINNNDSLKEDIIFIIKEKENLKRSQLEIYLNGVKLINQDQINQLKWSSNRKELYSILLEFQIKNYDLLKDNSKRDFINYSDLIKLFKTIPSSFNNKFPHIFGVVANDHIDEDQFFKFLINLPCLILLKLINCRLTNSFYDKLSNSICLNNLTKLVISEQMDLELNFNFILNLKKLKEFSTNQIIANHIDLINKLFKEDRKTFKFLFKFDVKNYIHISCEQKYNNGIYEIRSFYKDNIQKVAFNFIVRNLNLKNVIFKLKNIKF